MHSFSIACAIMQSETKGGFHMAKKDRKVKKKKEPKRKPKYGVFSCVGYIYRLLWKYEKGLAFTVIFTVPISLILSALALYTPSAVLSALETSDRFPAITLVICGLLLAKLLFDLANNITNTKIGNSEHYVLLRMMYMWNCRQRNHDWYLDFEPEIQKMNERADNAVQSNHTAGVHFPMDFSNMLSQILNFLLFGSVISLLHPVIILLLALGCVLNYFMSKWERSANRKDLDVRNDLDKKINYSTFSMLRDFSYAKDVRLYTMQEPLHDRLEKLFDLRLNEQKKVELRSILTVIEQFLVVLIRDGALQISDFREAMEIPDRLN